MIEVGWEQVRGFRLERSGLLGGCKDLVDATRQLCGVHAQVMSCAELALAARVAGLRVEEVREALWERRALVKTWAMRGTLHLLPADELALWGGALRTRSFLWRKPIWLRNFGVTEEELEAILEAVGSAVDGRGLTREEVAVAVGERAGERAREHLASGWGSLLKPVAMEGRLVFGPSRGRNVTFVAPRDWVGDFEPLEPGEAMREVVRRWLAAYGPGSHSDLAAWWGTEPRVAREALASLRDELVEVSVEGRRAWAPAGDADALRKAAPSGPARLLPGFDPYVVGFQPREGLVEPKWKARVSRTAGWISPVVLVEGYAVGVWEHKLRRGVIGIRVEPFRRLSAARRRELEADAERLGGALGAPASVTIAR